MPVTPRALKETKACPECGSTNRTIEPGEYSLTHLTGGNNTAIDVRALVCRNCGYTALFELK
jgi:predicted nucleic-acid-binding Zn-ribbon protein